MKKPLNPQPPRLLYALLKAFIRRDMKLYVLGDFDEEYVDIVEKSGSRAANSWFRRHFFRSLPKIFKETTIWRIEMFRNYLTIALRNMKRQKVFSVINILGMAIALMVCLWIFLFIKDEFSYDRFHENADSIYSVIQNDDHFNNKRRYTLVHTGPALKESFPDIEAYVRFSHTEVIVQQDDNFFQELCDFADSDFFKMFSYELIQGDPITVFSRESAVVLTSSLAKKYFGNQDPMGKTLTISIGEDKKDYLVTGIAKDVPSSSFLQFQMLMNLRELTRIYGPEEITNRNWSQVYTFIQLKEGVSPEAIEVGFPAFFERHFSPLIEERKGRGSWNENEPTISLWLQNLKDIYLYSQGIEGDTESRVSISYVLGGLGLLILFIACINFTNLSIGRASTRIVEIGMRKILGAYRKNLIRQFWSEAFLTVLFAMFLGIAAGTLLLPLFNRLAMKNIQEADVFVLPNLVICGIIVIFLSIVAGLYPGVALSRILPLQIFRGNLKLGGKNLLTRFLVIAQFSASIFLIISTLIVAKQVRYIFAKDLGYDREEVVVIKTFQRRNYDINAQIFDIYEAEAENLPYIKSVSGCVFPLSSEIGGGKLTFNDRRLDFNFTSVHYNFCETMGIRLIEGEDYPRNHSPDIDPILVNEAFVKAYEIENPIGTKISYDPPATQIIGVTEDFHFWNLKQKIEPTLIFLDKRTGPRNLLVRIDTSDVSRAISSLEKIWKKAQPNKPFDYRFEDEIFQLKYAEEKRWSGIVFFAAFFAVLISCMGLIGITTLAISRRVKEVGIRRVMGAPILKICGLLSWEYLVLVSISNLIAWPLGYYFMRKWIEAYAYRTDIGIGVFLLAGLLSLAISLITISFLVFKAAAADPVKSLRYE